MTDVGGLLAQAVGLGARMELQGDKVKVKAPAPLPSDLMDALRQHKQEIISLLQAQDQLTPALPPILPPLADPRAEAEDIAHRVTENGICLIWAETVQDFLAFVKDDSYISQVPPGFVIYTDSELKELFGDGKNPSPATLRLIHKAKKQGRGKVI